MFANTERGHHAAGHRVQRLLSSPDTGRRWLAAQAHVWVRVLALTIPELVEYLPDNRVDSVLAGQIAAQDAMSDSCVH
jgi:hypothetical protein